MWIMKDYLEKRREELSKREEGFTLMEMLIVVAIIAVLIAIAIPVFTSQLENSREATDAANLRSAYATATATLLTSDGTLTGVSAGPVTMQQSDKDTWQNDSLTSQKIGNATLPAPVTGTMYVNVAANGSVTITQNATDGYKVVDPVTGAATSSSSSSSTSGE